MKALVTGAAGFLGSHVVDRLLADGHTVRGLDLRMGPQDIEWFDGDICNSLSIERALRGCDIVYHLAANASVRGGFDDPSRDFRVNTVGAQNVLEAMRAASVRRIVFASSGSVYGNATIFPTPEDAPFPIPTSLYAASKIAGEALCCAYAEGYGFQVTILRFASLLGPGYARGHVLDFWRQLKKDPTKLTILGNPYALRSYIDARDAAYTATRLAKSAKEGVAIYNVAHTDRLSTAGSARIMAFHLGLTPEIISNYEQQGFAGDNPEIHLDTTRLCDTGWRPKYGLRQSVIDTIKYLESL